MEVDLHASEQARFVYVRLCLNSGNTKGYQSQNMRCTARAAGAVLYINVKSSRVMVHLLVFIGCTACFHFGYTMTCSCVGYVDPIVCCTRSKQEYKQQNSSQNNAYIVPTHDPSPPRINLLDGLWSMEQTPHIQHTPNHALITASILYYTW